MSDLFIENWEAYPDDWGDRHIGIVSENGSTKFPGNEKVKLHVDVIGSDKTVDLEIEDQKHEIVRMLGYFLESSLKKNGVSSYHMPPGFIKKKMLSFLKEHYSSVKFLSTYDTHCGLKKMLEEYTQIYDKSFKKPAVSRFMGFMD